MAAGEATDWKWLDGVHGIVAGPGRAPVMELREPR